MHLQLVESMSMQDRQIGAVHLAMQPALDSLIFQWSHAVEAVVDPGMSQLEDSPFVSSHVMCCSRFGEGNG